MKEKIKEKLEKLNHDNKKLYIEIFTLPRHKGHKKYLNNIKNKNLAIVGDCVLKLIFTDYLYQEKEKNITTKKKGMESNEKFIQMVKKFELDAYWPQLFPDYKPKYVNKDKATLFEAIMGAFYLQYGWNFIKKFICSNIKEFIE